MASITELLTPEEIERCFERSMHSHLLYHNLAVLNVKNLEFICYKILPLIFPNGIVTASEPIICIGWKFLIERAISKNLEIL